MKWSDVVKIWVVCYIGNLVGSLVAAFIFQASGAASGTVGQLFAAAAEKKMTAPAINLVLKGLLCNTLVCIAVWCSIKLKSESGKLIMIMWCILTFMVCGFEHSIANMTTMAVGMMNSTTGTLTIGGYIYNLVCVTIGNMIGGVVFVALPYYLISKKKVAPLAFQMFFTSVVSTATLAPPFWLECSTASSAASCLVVSGMSSPLLMTTQ